MVSHSQPSTSRIFGVSRIHALAAAMNRAWAMAEAPDDRSWHYRERSRSELHPAVLAACELANPKDWHELVLQWPHRSAKESGRLAYTQDEKKGEADRQTVTAVGKYLTRHFELPAHVIRGIADRFTVEGVFIWSTTEEMVRAAKEGPYSCMAWRNETGPHPYEVYSPEYGWKIAVRLQDGAIVGRALLLDDGEHKCFVRTYLRPADGNQHYSQRDYPMEAYLQEQGYSDESEWPRNAKLAKVRRSSYHGEWMFPYLDGNCQNVDDAGNYFVIREDGEYCCDNTDGSATESARYTCSCCGDSHRDEDDGILIGRYGDYWVGPCCSDDYVLVSGRRGEEYYISSNDAVEADGEHYDPEYLSDNHIVELENGDYCHEDNAFCCAIDDCWYHVDEVAHTEDEGCVHESNAWTCAVTGNVYSTNTDSAENSKGETVHPDELEEESEESAE